LPHPFAHADYPVRLRFPQRPFGNTHAIVRNTQTDPRRLAFERNVHTACLRMLGDVRECLLHDAVERDRPARVHLVEVLVDLDLATQARATRELLAMRPERIREPQTVELTWTQALDDLLLELHCLSERLQHALQTLSQLTRVLRNPAQDPVQIHVDGGQIAAEGVVQLASDACL